MHDRVVALAGGGEGARTPLLATFHSLSARILRIDAARIGRRTDFTIYDRDESIEVMKQAAADVGLPDDFASPHAILEHVSAQRNSRPGTSIPWPGRVWGTFEDDLVRTRERYEELLEQANALDFDDLLIQSVRVLEGSQEALRRVAPAVHARPRRRVPGHELAPVPARAAADRERAATSASREIPTSRSTPGAGPTRATSRTSGPIIPRPGTSCWRRTTGRPERSSDARAT